MRKKIELAYSVQPEGDSYLATTDNWAVVFSFWQVFIFFSYYMFLFIFLFQVAWKKHIFALFGFLLYYIVFLLNYFNKGLSFYLINSRPYFKRFVKKSRKLDSSRINRVKLINFYYFDTNLADFVFFFVLYKLSFSFFNYRNQIFSLFFSSLIDLQIFILYFFFFGLWIFLFTRVFYGLFSKE
jgi:hypothetical protein